MRFTATALALALVSVACSDSTGNNGEVTLASLSEPAPNTAVVVVVGSNISDVPQGQEVVYDYRQEVDKHDVVFDNDAGAGEGYVLCRFSVVDGTGTVFTHGTSELFRWAAPNGDVWVTAVNCPMTITSAYTGPGSTFTGHAECVMTFDGTTATVLAKFNVSD
jgi:hypothetical protein